MRTLAPQQHHRIPMKTALHADAHPATGWGRASAREDEGEQGEAGDQGLPGAEEEATEAPEAAEPVQDAEGALTRPLNATELADLIGRVVDQDQAAMASLYDALSGRVYASALHITRQVAMAEEVMQDTFWQIWRQAPRFDPARGTALAWVLNMARSRALDAMRSAQRDPVGAALSAPEAESEDTAGDPLDLLASARRDSLLHQTLSSLDPLKRQLIALAYYRGLTQDEIAAQTGMPLGTVKSHLRRTLAALRQALGQEGHGGWGPA
jgi:RNA polymerase sigma-70 factor (ECF subfamily)